MKLFAAIFIIISFTLLTKGFAIGAVFLFAIQDPGTAHAVGFVAALVTFVIWAFMESDDD